MLTPSCIVVMNFMKTVTLSKPILGKLVNLPQINIIGVAKIRTISYQLFILIMAKGHFNPNKTKKNKMVIVKMLQELTNE